MKHFVLRHFETIPNKNRDASLWELSPFGKKNSTSFVNSFDKNIKKIYSSTESKALYTAEQLGKKLSVKVIKCEFLKEIKRPGYLDNYEYELSLFFEKSVLSNKNWESYKSINSRVESILDLFKNEEETSLFISHGIFITFLMNYNMHKKYLDFWKKMKFGELYEI